MWIVTDLCEWWWDLIVDYPCIWVTRLCGRFIRADGPSGVNFRSHQMMDRPWWRP